MANCPHLVIDKWGHCEHCGADSKTITGNDAKVVSIDAVREKEPVLSRLIRFFHREKRAS